MNFLVEHNVPLAVNDHLSPLLRDIFPDSKIAEEYACARTKSTCIVNRSLAPYYKSELVDTMKSGPFSVAIDGSSDNGREKMNPMTVRFYDINRGRVSTPCALPQVLTIANNFNVTDQFFKKFIRSRCSIYLCKNE